MDVMSGQPQGAGPTSGEGHVPDLRAAAAELDAAGLNVIPIKADGTKMPNLPKWKQYQTERTTLAQHDKWFAPDRYDGAHTGIGYICGSVSGNVGMVEFEGRAVVDNLLDEAAELMDAHGLIELWDQLTTGYTRTSPSGGVHIDFRIVDGPVPRGTKIAQRPARDEELTAEERDRLKKNPKANVLRCLVETRGEGNLVVVDPSHGTVHRTGLPYQRRSGSPATIAVITAEEYEAVVAILGLLDQTPRQEYVQPGRKPAPRRDGGRRPGDDFNDRADWRDILAGVFRPLMTHGRTSYWGWADGVGGVKATTGRDPDVDRLYVFATSSEFDAEKAYTKFGAYTLLQHGGDWKAAAQELRRRGYGDPLPHEKLATVTELRPRAATAATDGSSALQDAPEPIMEHLEAGRPALDIGVEADAIDAILGLMRARKLPELFTRADGPVWITEDNESYPVMHHLNSDNLRAYMAEYVLTYTVVKDEESGGTKEVRTLLHPRTCSTILGRKNWPLPKLNGMVTSPVVRPDGSLLMAPGYDDATGIFVHPRIPLRRLREETDAASLRRASEIILNQM
ncbi:bifunctional DNA primase/polymerase, partial [Streptacidiphilus melanogenes]|uniref:bifunctional DNA primase/polymerase n=1 Tax=Streptacidiphilus melanogenes TaxID=411235 RepID=UPI00157B55C2